MNKNILYLLALVLLAALTYYFVFREEGEVFDKKEANFTVQDTAAVKTIFLSNLQNENIKLQKENGVWTLNDSMIPRPDAVHALLNVLHQQKPVQPVSVAYHDEVIKELSTHHTKVEVYTEAGKTHTFYVGRNPGPNNETYMLNEQAKRPYLVKIPLQELFVGVRYFTKISEWRNKKILYAAAPIEKVSVVYKDSTQFSYQLLHDASTLTLTGSYTIEKPLNQQRVYDYLKLLDNIYCTGFEDDYIYKDSTIRKGRQLATAIIKRKDQPEQEITFYFKPTSQGTKKIIYIGKEEYDYDLFFGLLNKKDFILMGRKSTEKVLRSFPEFYEASTQ
ncbi:MAG: DUF4340 domain-containing protein [Bacteroidetes bacterium]|nr:DUF4340 domain-containing protein [Bacteroidota bacterium]